MNRLIILLILTLHFIACKDTQKTSVKSEEIVANQTVEMVETGLSPMSQAEFENLYNNSTFIDYIWHDLPFSVSQSEPAAVKANVSFIGSNGYAQVPKNCKSIGRKSYQFNGDIYMDADIYYSSGCAYYIFLKDNKPVYLNAINENGKKFYNQLMKSAMETSNKLRNGEPTNN